MCDTYCSAAMIFKNKHKLPVLKLTFNHLTKNGRFGKVVEFSFTNWELVGSNPNSVTSTSVITFVLNNKFTKVQVT